MPKLARLSFFLAVLMAVGPHTARAMSLFSDVTVTLGLFRGGQLAPPGDPAIASFSHFEQFQGGSAAGSAFGSATFGTLSGSGAVAAAFDFPVDFGMAAQSQTAFGEVLTIAGNRVAFIAASGTLHGSGEGQLNVVISGGPHCTTSISTSVQSGSDTASCTTQLFRVNPLTNPHVSLGEELFVTAALALIHASNGATSSDFTDTAFISTIQAFDINGNELDATDFTVTSESGFNYPTGPLNATPEPTTLLLLGTTMAGIGLARWRRRRQN